MSFPRYESYKDSGLEWLGEVPEHWKLKCVRHLLRPSYDGLKIGPFGSQLTSQMLRESGYKVYGQENVIANDFNRGERFISEEKYQQLAVYELRPGDILITMMGTSGRCGIVPDNIEVGVMDSHLLRMRVTEEIRSQFLRLLIDESAYVAHQIRVLGKGSIMHGLNSSIIKELLLTIPAVDEQDLILSFLDRETAKIDVLIAEQQRLIELLKEKRQAVISHAVTKGLTNLPGANLNAGVSDGGPKGERRDSASSPDAPMKDSGIEWLGEVPEHWEVTALKRQCSLLKDGTHLPPARVGDGVPLLSVRNIQDGKFGLRDDDSLISEESYQELCKAFIPRPNDVLLAIVGATLGKTALVPAGLCDFHIQRSVAIFRPSAGMQSRWLNFVFQSQKFQQLLWEYVGFSAQPGIYLGTLAEFRIPLPPLPEQDSIASFLDQETTKLDTLTTEAQRAIDLLKERRTALISAAVTGKIDVRGLVFSDGK